MSSDRVVKIVPNNALCVDAEGLAERLTELGQRIKDGEFGEVERICVVIDGPTVEYEAYGRNTTNAYLIGILEWAKAKVMGWEG